MTLNQAKGYVVLGFAAFLIYVGIGAAFGWLVTTGIFAAAGLVSGLVIYGVNVMYKD